MKHVTIHRAQDIGSTVVVEPVCIVVGEPMPEVSSLAAHQMLATTEANALADALIDALPQCVLERLSNRLMAARTSDYIGRLGT